MSDTESVDTNEELEPFYETLTENEHEDLELSIYELIGEYIDGDAILKMSKMNFHDELVDDITHILFQHFNDAKILDDCQYDSVYSFVEYYTSMWFQSWICPGRHLLHYVDNYYVNELCIENESFKTAISNRIDFLRKKNENNPQQRTKEWYDQRFHMMTASNLWQTLGSDAQKNRFIYDKCKPIEENEETKWRTTEGSLHWGVKYEPLTVMIYEKITGAKIESLGCIQHPTHPFLGASPDGIVVNAESPFYGRLIEIKNIYNREMDGIPSEAYWIQIQCQLACCQLDVCDFIETRFKEYVSETEYLEETDNDKMRGIILAFICKDIFTPTYKYMPLDIIDRESWINSVKEELKETHLLFNTIYWYLDDIKMSTIAYNELWFDTAVKYFKDTWDTIEKERISGYEHRSPKKRGICKEVVHTDDNPLQNKVCVVKLTENETIHIETESIIPIVRCD
jgi:putative phage-type endonuclease